MDTRRFNQVPINLDRLSPEELQNLRGYVGQRLVAAIDEQAALDEYMGVAPNVVHLLVKPPPEDLSA